MPLPELSSTAACCLRLCSCGLPRAARAHLFCFLAALTRTGIGCSLPCAHWLPCWRAPLAVLLEESRIKLTPAGLHHTRAYLDCGFLSSQYVRWLYGTSHQGRGEARPKVAVSSHLGRGQGRGRRGRAGAAEVAAARAAGVGQGWDGGWTGVGRGWDGDRTGMGPGWDRDGTGGGSGGARGTRPKVE